MKGKIKEVFLCFFPALAPLTGKAQPAETAESVMRDIRGPVEVSNPWLMWMIALGLLILLAGILLLMHRLSKQRKTAAQSPPPVPPYEQALKELEAARGMIQPGNGKPFAVAASGVLRRYIERQFKMPAPERTTEEFLPLAMKHEHITGPLAALLASFLQQCDMVKFARQPLDVSSMEKLYAGAENFIKESHAKMAPAVPEAATAEPAVVSS